ncbi:hypothetical protein ACLB2K_014818 [Fragaria x ananassa]
MTVEGKDTDDLDEEPGEEIESAPPLKVGEEREFATSGLKKKLLKSGTGWESPEVGDEATVHYVGSLMDGTKLESTREREETVTVKIGEGEVVKGLEHGMVTMKKGEVALFTVPAELAYGVGGRGDDVPPNAAVRFEIFSVVSSCIAIFKLHNEEVLLFTAVKYRAVLIDGTVVAETPEEGIEFYVKDGHFCPALPKSIRTMKRGEKARLIVQPQYAFGEEGRDTNNGFQSIPPASVLNIDIELVSFKPVIDVTGDGKVLKKLLKEGESTSSAHEGATVTVSYIARLEDGTVFEKRGVDGSQPLEFITDEEQVIAGFDRAVSTMKKGEQAILIIHPDFGFGSVEVRRDLAVVPPSSSIVFEVEMLDFIKERAPWELSNQEKIKAAGRKKEEGNLLFKMGKYHRAGKKYEKAADYVSEDGIFGDDELKLAKPLRVSCWLNGAACNLKLNDFQEALKLCSKVLDVEFHNVKALYRRAQAYMELSDLFSASRKLWRLIPRTGRSR